MLVTHVLFDATVSSKLRSDAHDRDSALSSRGIVASSTGKGLVDVADDKLTVSVAGPSRQTKSAEPSLVEYCQTLPFLRSWHHFSWKEAQPLYGIAMIHVQKNSSPWIPPCMHDARHQIPVPQGWLMTIPTPPTAKNWDKRAPTKLTPVQCPLGYHSCLPSRQ